MNERSFTLVEMEGHLTSLFLVVTGNGILMLDGGCRRDADRLADEMAVRGLSLEDLRLVCVSHMHPDHAGGAPWIRKRLGTPIAAPSEGDRWYRGVSGWAQHKVDTLLAQYSAWRNGRKTECVWYSRRLNPDAVLMDGDTIPGFPDWQAFSAPGHTAHDMVFYHEASATLYAADIAIFRNNRYLLPFPVPFPDRMRATLDRLSSLRIRTLLLAHGGVRQLQEEENIFSHLIPLLDDPAPEQFQKLAPLCRLAPDIRKRPKDSN